MKKFSHFLLGVAASALVVGAAVDVSTTSYSFAQDAPAASEEAAKTAKFDESLFDVKDGEPSQSYQDQIAAIQAGLSAYNVTPETQDEFMALIEKARDAIKKISQKLFEAEDVEAAQRDMYFQQYAMLAMAAGETDALEALLAKYVAEETKNEQRATMLRYFIFGAKIEAADPNDVEGLTKIANEIKEAALANANFASNASSLILRGIQYKNAEVGAKATEELCAAFAASDDPILQTNAKRLEGAVRFAKLLGNEMTVEGLYLDKTEIDWASYRGKVVLVDFWATWCGPCIGEVPNVLKMYEKYSEAGFDVLGYSLDEDLDALHKFEEERKLPWKTASRKLSKEAEKEYVDLTEYYGVNAIPTMILVGKDGKVLSTSARGAELERLLGEQFPEVK